MPAVPLSPHARHLRYATWALGGLELGAFLFAIGLAALYLNPFWHFDDGGVLDWRLQWWNISGEIVVGAGLLIETLAFVGALAVLISRVSKRRRWPYAAALVLVCSGLGWVISEGVVAEESAHFEWNVADGFTGFGVQTAETAGGPRAWANPLWQSVVELQIQPVLRGYFKINDWRKMNGEVAIHVVHGIPIAWPLQLGTGGETLEDPDETPLMRAADQQDVGTLRELLATGRAEVNALDQGGETALILACRSAKANPEVVKALLAAGADVNLRARNGYAALTWALARKNGDIAKILRRAGARQ